ncbi:cytochrome P450 [Xylariomycetidae sp. FL0641]|nr:cytochrome P450 [Xylariomycetidae sp. FL0641]
MEGPGPYVLVWAALAIILLRWAFKRLFYPRPIPGIPYDQEAANRIMGDGPTIAAIYKEKTEYVFPMAQRSLRFGSPIHQFFMNPFTKPMVIVDDPREATDIVLRRNRDFDKTTGPGVWQTFIPHSTIAQSSSPEWKLQRKTWQDTMHPDFLKRVVAGNIYQSALELTNLWKVRCDQAGDKPIDVSKDFSYAALDAIWTAAFGERLELVNSKITELQTGQAVQTKGLDMHRTVDYINHLAELWRGSLWPAFSQWRVKRSPDFQRYMQFKDREIDRLLLAAKARFERILDGQDDGERHDTCAMDLVLRRSMLAAQKAGKPFPDPTKDKKMRDELVLFIYGGHDTTSTTLQWFVKFMTNNPAAQTKLRETLRAALPGPGLPDVTAILGASELPYLRATMEETLRCASTASRLIRVATADTSILGHAIPAGTEIMCHAGTRWHPVPVPEDVRSPSSRAAFQKAGARDWAASPAGQDLDAFAPERWLKRADDDGEGVVFDAAALPQNSFGGGPRGCFGKRLGRMELQIMITLVTLSFRFLPVPAELNSFQVTEAVLRPPVQCFVKLEAC